MRWRKLVPGTKEKEMETGLRVVRRPPAHINSLNFKMLERAGLQLRAFFVS